MPAAVSLYGEKQCALVWWLPKLSANRMWPDSVKWHSPVSPLATHSPDPYPSSISFATTEFTFNFICISWLGVFHLLLFVWVLFINCMSDFMPQCSWIWYCQLLSQLEVTSSVCQCVNCNVGKQIGKHLIRAYFYIWVCKCPWPHLVYINAL